ncbi:MAG TPA: hypothetical protein VFD00_10500 [Thermoclostridium sp.]|nr:hypothetical protein [Thermoclostridium sp.]
MKKEIIAGIISIIILLTLTLTFTASAAVAHAHDAGVPDCRIHSMQKTCWGSTTHMPCCIEYKVFFLYSMNISTAGNCKQIRL